MERYRTRTYREPIINGTNLSNMVQRDIKLTLAQGLAAIDLSEVNLEGKIINDTNEPLDLTRVNFEAAMLGGATLNNTNLSGVNLERVNFTDGSLVGSDLTGARITDADLIGTDLTDAILLEIESSNVLFNFANLTRANLSGSRFTNASFHKAKLTHTNFTGAQLQNANFTKAKLDNTIFIEAQLENADFQNMDLRNTVMTGVNLAGANLTGAILTGVNLAGVNLAGADLTGADLRGAKLTGANLEGASLAGANLRLAKLIGANLTNANLMNADLTEANLENANLTSANLRGADLRSAILINTNFTNANLTNANLSSFNATNPVFTGATLTGALFEDEEEDDGVDFEEMKKAIQSNNIAKVEEFVNLNLRYVTVANKVGETPLYMTAYFGHLAIVKYLVDNGANINLQEPRAGWSPLHMSISEGKTDVVEYLINQGADWNMQTRYGETPLILAFRKNKNNSHLEIIKMLLIIGADITIEDVKGQNALYYAEEQNNAELIKLLTDIQDANDPPIMLDIVTVNRNQIPQEANDFVNMEDVNIQQFLQEDPQNKVIKVGENFYATNGNDIQTNYLKQSQKNNYIYYPCKKVLPGALAIYKENVYMDKPIFSASYIVGVLSDFVLLKEVKAMIKSEHQYFEIIPSEVEHIPANASAQMLTSNRDAVGANHCQEGKEGKILKLKMINIVESKATESKATENNEAEGKRRKNKSRKGVLKTRAKPKAKPGKKSRVKKDKRKKSQKK